MYATNAPPTYPVYNPDGTYFGWTGFNQMNPVAVQMLQKNTAVENFKLISPTISYDVTNELTVEINGSFLNRSREYSFYRPTIPGVGNVTEAYQSSSTNRSLKGELDIMYESDWKKIAFP